MPKNKNETVYKKSLTFLILILIGSLAFIAVAPSTYAAPATPETTTTAKGLSILNQVVGVDLAKYNATPTVNVNGSYKGVLPSENVRYTLNSNGSKLDVLNTFTNGHLQMIDVLENDGSPHVTTSAADTVEMANTFLLNYQTYSESPFYGQLASTLNKVDPSVNSTALYGNVQFKVTSSGDRTTFTWSYTSNGIDAIYKCVSLSYQNGFLKTFIDTWNLYSIGSTAVDVSKQEAEAIAMQTAKTFSWKVGSGNATFVVDKFNVTQPVVEQLVFCEAGNAIGARSNDPLMLYPMWRIGVGLDKFYPGNVYGIYVDVWADTKQVRGVQEVFSTLPPPAGEVATLAESSTEMANNQTANIQMSSSSFLGTWIVCPVFVVFIVGIIFLWLFKKKNASLFHQLSKPPFFKIKGAFLCLLICSAAFAALLPTVQTAKGSAYAEIWSDSSDGSNNTLLIPYDNQK